MARLQTVEAGLSRPPLNAATAGALVAITVAFDIAADNAGVAIATSDVVELFKLPRGHKLVDLTFDTEAIATAVVDIGFVDGVGDTGDEFISAQATTSAALARASTVGFIAEAVNEDDHRIVAATFTTGTAATTGAFYVTGYYRASHHGL